MFVNFQALDLPKEEDFYQFQFLRTDENGQESAIGASLPFQLQPHSHLTHPKISLHIFNSVCHQFKINASRLGAIINPL